MSLLVILLKTIAFLDLLAIGLIMPLVSSHSRKLGANQIHIGLLGSVYAAFQLVSSPIFGSLSDLKGRKPILIISILICAVAYVLTGFTTSLQFFIILRAVLGIFKHTQTLNRAMVSDYVSTQRRQSDLHGKLAAISGAGITLGPVVGGHIIDGRPEDGFALISLIVGFIFVLNAGLVYMLPKPTVRKARKKQRSNYKGNMISFCLHCVKESFEDLRMVHWSKYWQVFLLKGFIGFTMGVYYSNYSTYLRVTYGLTQKYIGYIISFQGLIGVVFSYSINFINKFYTDDDNCSQKTWHVFLLITISIIGLILSKNVYFYLICLIPLAIGNAIGRLVTMEMIITGSDVRHRGTLIGASNSVRSLTGIVSPMVAGFIAQYLGVEYVIYASLISSLLGTITSYFINICKIREKID